MFGLDTGLTALLLFCIFAAVVFEFINGFHDTANAVATVIYTNSMSPQLAVMWSGLWNFIGVLVGGIAVAIGIINLLPTEALIDQDVYHSVAMILALIITAIIWNIGTWYFGIPCSSSHTLIGSIFGVGIAYMLLPGSHAIALNWSKVADVGLSLLISPIFGFGIAILLMLLLRYLVKNKKLFHEPHPKKKPPFWIRFIIVFMGTSVSFSHGSNDGQKGVGLVMIILIGIVPAQFAIDREQNPEKMLSTVNKIEITINKIESKNLSKTDNDNLTLIKQRIDGIQSILYNIKSFSTLSDKEPFELRKDIILISKNAESILSHYANLKLTHITETELSALRAEIKILKTFTEYSPWWVILLISTALGLGTMVGWKRIVVTIGEKIGKTHLNYAQAASSELIAASTIGASTWLGLPVSTTHVLSSAIAGSMVAGGGIKNLQPKTLKSIGIAWLVTLPVTVLMAGVLFLVFRLIFS